MITTSIYHEILWTMACRWQWLLFWNLESIIVMLNLLVFLIIWKNSTRVFKTSEIFVETFIWIFHRRKISWKFTSLDCLGKHLLHCRYLTESLFTCKRWGVGGLTTKTLVYSSRWASWGPPFQSNEVHDAFVLHIYWLVWVL